MAPPAQYNHCERVYEAMLQAAETTKLEGKDVATWEGHTTKLFQELGLTVPYYTSVTQKLQAMGCLIQLHRGGGGGMSKWALIYPPTEEIFNNSKDRVRSKPTAKDQWEQRLRDLSAVLQEITSNFEVFDARLDHMDTQIKDLAKEVDSLVQDVYKRKVKDA